MNEKFNLRVYFGNSYEDITIEAYSYSIDDGHIQFLDEYDNLVASYPSDITAIKSIKSLKEKKFF